MRHLLPFARHFAAGVLLLAAAGCLKGTEPTNSGPGSDPATETYAASLGVNISQMTKVSDNLYIQDVAPGNGTQAAVGKSVNVKYTGWLVNGTQFDSNSIAFPLGVGAVIPGWDLGLVGMRVGGTRRLVIGSALAYGSGGNPPVIPGNATLVFVVQLLSAQ
jgi:FKBP-type peptidyl-prolyl cis-trans isomerase